MDLWTMMFWVKVFGVSLVTAFANHMIGVRVLTMLDYLLGTWKIWVCASVEVVTRILMIVSFLGFLWSL